MSARLIEEGGQGGKRGYVGRHRTPRMRAMASRLGVVLTRLLGPSGRS